MYSIKQIEVRTDERYAATSSWCELRQADVRVIVPVESIIRLEGAGKRTIVVSEFGQFLHGENMAHWIAWLKARKAPMLSLSRSTCVRIDHIQYLRHRRNEANTKAAVEVLTLDSKVFPVEVLTLDSKVFPVARNHRRDVETQLAEYRTLRAKLKLFRA